MAGVLAALLSAGPAVVSAGTTTTTTLFTLKDKRLTEASGIAQGIVQPDRYYVQNDSGDSARFFALDASTGTVRAVYTVPGATNVDWEDLAVAPNAYGVPSVWLADIGDNSATRSEVRIYQVREPSASSGPRTGRPQVWRLRYPSGPVNAESLAVSPTGRAYIVTKSPSGVSAVYQVPPTPDANHVQTLKRIGTVRFHASASVIPASLQDSATGAAISADGTLLAVRTYTAAYVWRVSDDDVAAALRAAPTRLQLPLQPQGEGVCFVGTSLVVDSEHVGSAVYSVPLPAALAAPPSDSGVPSNTAPSSNPAVSISNPLPTTASPQPHATRTSSRFSSVLIVMGLLVLATAVVKMGQRRRRG